MPAPVAMRLKFAASCVPGTRRAGAGVDRTVPCRGASCRTGKDGPRCRAPFRSVPARLQRRRARGDAARRGHPPCRGAAGGCRERARALRRCSPGGDGTGRGRGRSRRGAAAGARRSARPRGCGAAERSVRCARNVARPRPYRRRVGDGGRGGARRSTERRRGHRPGCGGASPAGAARVRHERGGARPRVDPDRRPHRRRPAAIRSGPM